MRWPAAARHLTLRQLRLDVTITASLYAPLPPLLTLSCSSVVFVVMLSCDNFPIVAINYVGNAGRVDVCRSFVCRLKLPRYRRYVSGVTWLRQNLGNRRFRRACRSLRL